MSFNGLATPLQQATRAGTAFVFGYLGGGDLLFDAAVLGSSFIFIFQVLPLVLVISAIMMLLYYWRILPGLVQILSSLPERMMSFGGAEYFFPYDQSTAVDPSAFGTALPQRPVPGDELRHGHYLSPGRRCYSMR